MAELDDDREGIEPEALDEDAGDPAAAFDALRQTVEDLAGDLTREMTTIRKGVERAFEEFDRYSEPEDYKPQLAQIVQHIVLLAKHVDGVENSPLLRNGPQHYAAVLERSGEGLIRTAAQQLERQASDLERAGRNLAAHTKSAYDRKSQDSRMWMAGLIGLFVGIFLILLLPRFLPFSADSHVASLVMGRDRVSAGHTMIRAADPFEAQKITWGGQFYDAGGGEISVCLEAARRTGTDQQCTVTVPAPAQ